MLDTMQSGLRGKIDQNISSIFFIFTMIQSTLLTNNLHCFNFSASTSSQIRVSTFSLKHIGKKFQTYLQFLKLKSSKNFPIKFDICALFRIWILVTV